MSSRRSTANTDSKRPEGYSGQSLLQVCQIVFLQIVFARDPYCTTWNTGDELVGPGGLATFPRKQQQTATVLLLAVLSVYEKNEKML